MFDIVVKQIIQFGDLGKFYPDFLALPDFSSQLHSCNRDADEFLDKTIQGACSQACCHRVLDDLVDLFGSQCYPDAQDIAHAHDSAPDQGGHDSRG
jgi:hypothetical protein